MADWSYTPRWQSSIEFAPPATLVSTLSDATEIRRQKHSNAPETWTEEYWFSGSEFDAAKTFYDGKGLLTSFTKVSYDVHGTPTQERTVRFAGPFTLSSREGPDWYVVQLVFARVY